MTRKTKTALITVCLLLTAAVVSAFAAAGGTSDPLASLSYLTGTFTDAVDQQVEEKLDASDQAIRSGESGASGGAVSTWTEIRLKEGDVLTGSTGTGVLVLAGSGRVTFTGGAVVDVTTGNTVSSGSALTVNHRYLVAEDTSAAFTITGGFSSEKAASASSVEWTLQKKAVETPPRTKACFIFALSVARTAEEEDRPQRSSSSQTKPTERTATSVPDVQIPSIFSDRAARRTCSWSVVSIW